MTGPQLKNSILQLAIQGKLVPQDPNDEPASALLERICKEKEQLVKEGKLKKKDLVTTPISDEEKPFEIPEGWEWCRLKDVLFILTDGTHSTPKYVEQGIPFISVKNMSSGVISFEDTKFITQEEHEELTKRCFPEYGDILLSKVGTTGVPALIETYVPFSIFVSIALLKFPHDKLYAQYLINLINSPLVQEQAQAKTRGVGNKNWVIKDIESTLIPLPPLAEQHRIVAKIEELMPLVEKYDKAQSELEALNNALPESLKKSILQEAIQGKLGTNNPDDEPASELLKRIRAEKAKLIKDKKIKKEKPLAPITEEEKPFEIPENWEWVRLGEVIKLLSGQDLTPERYFDTEVGIPYITGASHFVNCQIVVSRWTESPTSISHIGDLLITCKGTVGTMAYNDIGDIHIARQIMAISPICVHLPFIKYFLEQVVPELEKQARSIIPGISRDVLLNTPFPLPPLAEQHRIVEKLNSILPKLENLKNPIRK